MKQKKIVDMNLEELFKERNRLVNAPFVGEDDLKNMAEQFELVQLCIAIAEKGGEQCY